MDNTQSKSTPFNYADRDMLIILNTKVDILSGDIKDLKDSLAMRVSKTEQRLDAMDVYHAGIPLQRYDKIANWTENFRSNIKFILAVSLLFASVIGALVERFLQVWFKF